jgi:hypothetical protein
MTAQITWDLRLHPPALNTAFWQDESGRLVQSDRQVCSSSNRRCLSPNACGLQQ